MRLFRALIVLILIITSSFFGSTAAAQDQNPVFEVEAQAAVLLDFASNQILYSQNGRAEHVPASLVKIMTMYVAQDQISRGRVKLEDTTTVGETPWRQTGSKMFLEPGEVVTIEQLLKGIAVVSGNDACVALAEALAGSESLYVQWMNDKAAALGLELKFVDVHGLSSENSITAEDAARLVWFYLKEHPQAVEYHQQLSFAYQPRSSKSPIVQNNRNGLLHSFEGADGLKTGHLEAAGYNLIGTAVQNNRRLIAVVLGAASEGAREREAAKLLTYGYRNFDLINISPLLEERSAAVLKGRRRTVPLAVKEALIAVPKGVEQDVKVGIQTRRLEAPVQKGAQVGMLSIFVKDELLKEVPLLAAEEVPRGNIWRIFWDSVISFFQNLIRKRR